jgi:hypothetical protein
MIDRADACVSATTGTQPRITGLGGIQPTFLRPSTFLPPISQPQLFSLCTGFLVEDISERLDSRMVEIFGDLRQITITTELREHAFDNITPSEHEYLEAICIGMEHRLLCLLYGQSDVAASNFQQTCCLAAMIYTNTALWNILSTSTILDRLVERLVKALTQYEGSFLEDVGAYQVGLIDILLWICFLGAHASHVPSKA